MNHKSEFLGMNFSTAAYRLRKSILFALVQETGRDMCFHCGHRITDIRQLSIEHKKPWLDISTDLFWDLENIAFSHLSCNCRAGRERLEKNMGGHHPNSRRNLIINNGEANVNAKLNRVQVLEIRKLRLDEHLSYQKLGKRYNVSSTAIRKIVKRITWRHI